MTSIILLTRRPNCQYKVCYALASLFQLISFFVFWGEEKHVFHIASFRPTRYELKRFTYLEVSNRVRKWNKVKNNIYLRSKIQLCQLETPIFLNKFMWQSSLINTVSFLFCEFNRVVNWNEGKTIILVDHHFKFPIRNTCFIFKVIQCQCTHVFS